MSSTLITSVPDFKAFARGEAAPPEAKDAHASAQLFGKDGLSFGDVLDAINPLNHIPIVSDMYSNLMDHKASAGARLAGGALFGGPVGLVASMASLMFEEGTGGKSPTEAVYAALASPSSEAAAAPATQFAQNEANAPLGIAPANALALPQPRAQQAASAPVTPVELAELQPSSSVPMVEAAKNALAEIPVNAAQTVLDLYGASAASAHGSYQKAQMLTYLRDVTVSKAL